MGQQLYTKYTTERREEMPALLALSIGRNMSSLVMLNAAAWFLVDENFEYVDHEKAVDLLGSIPIGKFTELVKQLEQEAMSVRMMESLFNGPLSAIDPPKEG